MAEGIEPGDSGRPRDEGVDQPENDEATTSFPDTPASEPADSLRASPADATGIRELENAPKGPTRSIEAQQRELTKTRKVDAFLKAVADRYGLLPGKHMHIYDEFVLGENKRDLYLKDGLTRVNYKRDSTKYLVLPSIGGAEFKNSPISKVYHHNPPHANQTAGRCVNCCRFTDDRRVATH